MFVQFVMLFFFSLHSRFIHLHPSVKHINHINKAIKRMLETKVKTDLNLFVWDGVQEALQQFHSHTPFLVDFLEHY